LLAAHSIEPGGYLKQNKKSVLKMKSEMEMGKRDYGFKEDQRERRRERGERKKESKQKGLACSLRSLLFCLCWLSSRRARNQPAYSKELQTARVLAGSTGTSLEGHLEGKGQ
jgi:hypothetical protein